MTTDTDLVVITPASSALESPEIVLAAKISEVVADCMLIKVTDDDTLRLAADGQIRLRAFNRELERSRKEYLKPRQDFIYHVNDKFADLELPIATADAHLETESRLYRDAINAAAAKEQAHLNKIAENAQKRAEARGETSPVPEVVTQIVPGAAKTIETDAGKVSYRLDWKAQIVDTSKLPRDYLIPNETKIFAVVRASKGTITIPGVRNYSIEIPVTRMRGA